MHTVRKRLLAILLTLAMVVSLFPVSAFADAGEDEGSIAPVEETAPAEDLSPAEGSQGSIAPAGEAPEALPPEPVADEIQASSGSCGSKLTWTYSEGVLTISGTGDMTDYSSDSPAPWNSVATEITRIEIQEGATSLGNHAFCKCSNLMNVTLPDTLRSIGIAAFEDCTNLGSLTIPEGVTTIGEWAFSYCNSLRNISIPESVTQIEDCTFYYCAWMDSIIIPSSVTIIGEQAFHNCIRLKSITIPSSVTSIGEGAFSWCEGLTSVSIPSSVTSIGEGSFQHCTSLTNVEIPEGTTIIEPWAFGECEALTSVTISGTVTSIGRIAFSRCGNLKEIHFHGSAPEFGSNCFSGVTATAYYPVGDRSWTEEVRQSYGGTITWEAVGEVPAPAVIASGACSAAGSSLTWTLDETGTLTISGTGKMRDYYELDEDREREWAPAPWYSYKDQVTRIIVEEGVTHIGMYAFKEMDKVTQVRLPSTLETIYGYAFEGCAALSDLEILHVDTISTSAFEGCSALSDLVLPEGLVTIYTRAFYNCSGLRSVSIPASLKTFGDESFGRCTALEAVRISDLSAWCGITFSTYGSSNPLNQREPGSEVQKDVGLYVNGEKLTDLVIPADVTSIAPRAFYGYTGLESIVIPDTVNTVGDSAFSACTNLQSVSADAATIGNSAFEFCGSLEAVSLGENVTAIGRYVFQNCGELSSVNIPAALKSIGHCAFHSCGKLQRVDLTDLAGWCGISFSTGSWGDPGYGTCYSNPLCNSSASLYLNGALLEDAVISDGVTYIDAYAFYCDSDLRLVRIPSTMISIGQFAFASCGNLTDVYYSGTQEQWDAVSVSQYNDPLTNATIHFTESPVTSGTCGDNLTWAYEDGVLVISGEGEMADFSEGTTPWHHLKDSICTVVIKSGVTGIGDYAFMECSSITKLTVPASVSRVGSWAVHLCTGLKTAGPIDGGYDYEFGWTDQIPDRAFDSIGGLGEYPGLTAVTIPDSITVIGAHAFSGCRGLTDLKLPNSLQEIGTEAFYGCEGLSSLTIPGAVTSIQGYAFWSCGNLSEIHFSGSAPEFGDSCFSGVTATAYYPANDSTWTEEIRQSYGGDITWFAAVPEIIASGTCGDNLTWTLDENGLLTISGTGDMYDYPNDEFEIDGAVPVPMAGDPAAALPSLDTQNEELGPPWDPYRDSVKKVILEAGVTSIGIDAFRLFDQITEVTIPNTVTLVGSGAFRSVYHIEHVFYGGTEAQRAQIRYESGTGMQLLPNAVWHYTEIVPMTVEPCEGVTVTLLQDYAVPGEKLPVEIAVDPAYRLTQVLVNGTAIDLETYVVTDETAITLSFVVEDRYPGHGAVTASGYCGAQGDNLGWVLYEDGTLYITGTGAMVSYYSGTEYPWYDYRKTISSLIVEEGATTIGSYAFCIDETDPYSALSSVSLPSTLTMIGTSSFQHCSRLTEIQIPENVTSIRDWAFASCRNLKTVNFPAGLLSIEYGAFSSCKSISTLVLPNGITYIDTYAFAGCTGLKKMTLPESLSEIGSAAFQDCSSLTAVSFPDTLTTIRGAAFSGCSRLQELNLPEGLTVLESHAFRDCSGIRGTLVLPSTLSEVSVGAFQNCSGLTGLTLPEGIVSISGEAFQNCGLSGELILPSTLKTIDSFVFEGSSFAGDLSIPDDCSYVGLYAFSGCSFTGSLILPRSLSSIYTDAFNGCGFTGELILPAIVDSIGDGAFRGNNFTAVTIRDSLTEYGNEVFAFCEQLREVTLPEGMTRLPESMFYSCHSLAGIVLPEGMEAIDGTAFYDCSSLQWIQLPESITEIASDAFDECGQLRDVLYGGTEEQRGQIQCGDQTGNELLTNATWHYGKTAADIVPMTVEPCEGVTVEAGSIAIRGEKLPLVYEMEAVFLLKEVRVNGTAIDLETYVVTDESAITVSFVTEDLRVPITIEDCPGITVSPLGEDYVLRGDKLPLVYEVDPGFRLLEVRVNGTAIDLETYVVTDEAAITVSFVTEDLRVPITVEACDGVSVRLLQDYAVRGEKLPVEYEVEANLEIQEIQVNGIPIDINTYVVTDETAIVLTFVVRFLGVPITIEECPGITASVSTVFEDMVWRHQPLPLVYTVNPVYRLLEIRVNGTAIDLETYVVNDEDSITVSFVVEDRFPGHGAATAYGNCGAQGDNLRWVYYQDRTLIIFGSGEMEDFEDYSLPSDDDAVPVIPGLNEALAAPGRAGTQQATREAPWDGLNIDRLILEEGVTSVGANAFFGDVIRETDLPESIVSIGDSAFGWHQEYQGNGLYLIRFAGSAPNSGSGFYASIINLALYPKDDASWTEDFFRRSSSRITWVGYRDEATYNTVQYELNGGEGLSRQFKGHNVDLLLTSEVPTRTGYRFLGWATEAESQDVQFRPGDSYTRNEDLTLYAVWELERYTVSFDANGGEGAPEAVTKTYSQPLTLPETQPTRADDAAPSFTVTLDPAGGTVEAASLSALRTNHYSFQSWNTAPNGYGASYAPGASYTAEGDATLYAQWSVITSTAPVDLPTPVRSHYAFRGWSTSSSASGGITGSYTPGSDVTLYAIWELIPDGVLTVENTEGSHGKEITIPVDLSANPGLHYLSLQVRYDSSRMDLLGVEDGSLTGWKFTHETGILQWMPSEMEDSTEAGTIVALRFQLYPTAADGNTEISVSVVDAVNLAEEKLVIFGTSASVYIHSRMPGDINGDDEVSILDLVRLLKHLAGEPVLIQFQNADVTGDGEIDGADLVRLRKYLVGFPDSDLD